MKIFSILFFIILFCGQITAQKERIINYDVQIEVSKDRSITVIEHIEVYADGAKIKRGITRRLPVKRFQEGVQRKMNYIILDIRKNGEPEPYFLKRTGSSKTIYIGEQKRRLVAGIYKYQIKYRVKDQIALLDTYDEIYWNAVGNDVQFEVENASCRVRLPGKTQVVQESAYKGKYGDRDQSFTSSFDGTYYDYRITSPLKPGEGFSVAVGFEKGYVEEPRVLEKYGTLIMALLGIFLLGCYYIYTWFLYGKDPPTPPSYPIFSAPDDLSAASISYIKKGRYENKSFAASIVDLAIKGFVKIEEISKKGLFSKSKIFDLVKVREPNGEIPQEEKEIMIGLFAQGDRVSIDGEYDEQIESTCDGHSASLSQQHKAFIREGHNSRLLLTPSILTLLFIAATALTFINSSFLTGINLIALIAMISLSILGFVLFAYLIKKPSEAKLDLRSRIMGFSLYLEMAEKDRLNLLNPPELTPQHFEEVLPYAIALGVEHRWSAKFKHVLESAAYQPQWNNSTDPVYFSDHFGKHFSNSLSSSTSPPQQSSGSGSGGGGFAGGGGGGGGVGGW